MLRDAKLNRLYRTVLIKILFPLGIFPTKTITYHAEPHQGYGPEAIDDILMKTADKLDEQFPFWEFKVIPLAAHGRRISYVLAFAGYRAGTPVAAMSPEQAAIAVGTISAARLCIMYDVFCDCEICEKIRMLEKQLLSRMLCEFCGHDWDYNFKCNRCHHQLPLARL